MDKERIQLSASLYSLSSYYIKEIFSLEDCLREIRDYGFKGIEIVAAQMVPEYPNPSDKWLGEFKELLDKYELKPICYSAYIDYGIRSDRDLTEEEIIQFTLNDMIYAKKAGFPLVRTQHSISPAIYEKMIPHCERLDIKLAIEMHHPHHPRVDVWEKYIELMHTKGKGYLGVVPDFSIFQVRPHKLLVERLLKAGFRKEQLDRVLELHENKVPLNETLKLDLNALEKEFTESIYEKFNPTPIEELSTLIPVTPYIHGKFYYLENGEADECIPYDRILPEIKRLGYEGYIAAEYEGHHFNMDIDVPGQLRRYVSICSKYI
ncbi:xylose isomerase-like TIM barrel protein [Anaerobacterium chartisolvens]|uniref:Xylose isomerase-like TIM barrel protein n=1 Tax=Anaerobacterium chartisolvens TaxID=1297424 RepID=A0A369ANH0_9FIRM|nr:TIM barrel protein [Anaerobacterium chartisolvens]RCX09868.1 xylose isomerase-like TIM barrel protein [Anaerobacterium chartisolvens]